MRNLLFEKNRIVVLIALVTPLLAMIIMMLTQGLWFNRISISCSMWNDELIYFKQVEGMLDYGNPIGYYGYSESHAAIGTYGAWGPVVLMPFMLFGKIFGWTTASPIIANLLFVTVALVLFAVMFKPSIIQQVFISLIYISYGIATRYIVSSTPESILLALAFIYCILTYKVILEEDNLGMRIVAYILMFYITAARGYYAIFSLMMMAALLKRRKIVELLIQAVSLLVAVLVFFYVVGNYCAPYFGSTLDTSVLTNVNAIMAMMVEGMRQTFSLMQSSLFVNDTLRGSWYVAYFVLGIVLLIAFAIKRNLYTFTSILMWIVLILAMWILYNPQEGARQLMNCTLIGLIFITYSIDTSIFSNILKGVVVIAMLYIFWFSSDSFYVDLPAKNDELVAEMKEQNLSELMPVDAEPWNNTVIWTLTCPFDELYALPSGFGINCCYDDFVISYFDYVQSKYIAVGKDGDVDYYLQNMGYQAIVEYGSIKIYSIR